MTSSLRWWYGHRPRPLRITPRGNWRPSIPCCKGILGKFHKFCCEKHAVKRLTRAKREKCISLCRHTTVQGCMQFQILRFFVDLPRKNRAATIFRTLRFSVTSLYFSLNWRIPNSRNSAKIEERRDYNDFLHFTIFRYFLVCLTYQTWPPNSTNSAKMAKNRGCNDFSHFTISQYFFHFLTYQTGLPNSTNSLKSSKKVPFARFTIFPYVFITWQNGRCKTHCTYITSWRRSVTRIESRNLSNISTVIWRTMRASISRLCNICFVQLALYSKALLNHTSPIPKAAAREAILRNAGAIPMRTNHKVSSVPYE